MKIQEFAQSAKTASISLSAAGTELKNNALLAIADALKSRMSEIILANNQDIERSEKENLEAPLLKRLKFDEDKINGTKPIYIDVSSMLYLYPLE